MTKRTALIAGGGIAGTIAAIALHRAGYTSQIYEAYPRDADERGAFLTVAVNGLAALRALDLDPAELLAAGYATPTLRLGNGAGRLLAELPLGGPEPDGTTTTTIRRADLYRALRAEAVRRGIPIAYEKRLTGLDQDPDGVTARFADGSTAAGDLLVGADGLHSRSRDLLNPGPITPRYLGLLNAGGFTTSPVQADLDRTPGVVSMAFGKRSFFGWTVAPDGSVWWFANPPSKRPIDPRAWTEPAWRAHLLELFADDAIPAAAIIRATGEVIGPWNTFDLPRVPVWRSGRAVLAGDAAHAVSPSSGQGASMAVEDAVTLGRCLATAADVPTALAAYESARRARVEKVVVYGRRSGSTKTVGPIGAAIRDAMTPPLMRFLYRKGNPQSWILDYRVEPFSAASVR
jgi:2-polyprenyl-6-methoxyphenol hydroxylase-like FAD-dependent oxidoreductase